MLTLDTSGLVALISPSDPYHQEAVATLEADAGPYYVPAAILAEIAYILEKRAGPHLVLRFVQNLISRALTFDCAEQDLPRVFQLMERYGNLALGLADAVVIACAERHDGRVLTTDWRHFPVVARGEGTITVLPEPR